jgi:hypothetical protein
MAIAVNGYTPPNGITTNEQVKALQQQLNAGGANLKVDGVYGPLTQAAYMASSGGGVATPATTAVYADPSFEGYYNSIKASLVPQTVSYAMPDMNALTSQIAAYLRPAYDQAIANRQNQTVQNRADIDADAASRGMGRSSWVTDVKARESKAEATDIANLESNYGAALAEAVLGQYNQHLNNKLQVDLANAKMLAQYEQLAYDRAGDMYNLMQASKKSNGGNGSRKSGEYIDWDAYINSLTPAQKYELVSSPSNNSLVIRSQMANELGNDLANSKLNSLKTELKGANYAASLPGNLGTYVLDQLNK